MVELTGIAHFAIPVSDPERSTRFYTEIVGCRFLHTLPDKSMTSHDLRSRHSIRTRYFGLRRTASTFLIWNADAMSSCVRCSTFVTKPGSCAITRTPLRSHCGK